jgi:exonuclease SbcD
MRLVHTSDWHLGHRLHGVPREREHARFLRWLVDRLVEEQADALVIAGDIFDTANPPAEAQRAFYQFLAACLKKRPRLDIVVIAGNHDSPARLDATADVLRPLGVHLIGSLPRDEDGDPDPARALVPLSRSDGAIAAWLVAVPYLRPSDWPPLPPLQEGAAPSPQVLDELRALYAPLFAAARKKRRPGQALIAAGHCLLRGGTLSEGSERRIQLGNSLPLPADLFPEDLAYVALGHLHRAQQIDSAQAPFGSRHLRYSGSPIPLAFSERTYPHQVVLVELDGEALREVRPLPVPRRRQVLSIPEEARPLDEVVALLKELPRAPDNDDDNDDDEDAEEPPLLEVRVRQEPGAQAPLLRPIIEEALVGARPRLVRIVCERPGLSTEQPLSESETPLLDLHPEEIFLRLYQRTAGDPGAVLPPAQLALFRRLFDQLEKLESDGGLLP